MLRIVYADCRLCCVSFKLNATMLCAVMLNVNMLNVIMLSTVYAAYSYAECPLS